MQCPVCGVVNEPDRTQCVCGFELRAPEERVTDELRRRMTDEAQQTWVGAAAIGGPLLILVLFEIIAPESGRPFRGLLFGTMGGGAILIVRAYFRVRAFRARLPTRHK